MEQSVKTALENVVKKSGGLGLSNFKHWLFIYI